MENIRVVEGKQVYLRYMTVEDTDMILRWRNSPIVRDNFIYRKEITREDHLNWIKNKIETGQVVQFVVCDKETDKPYGSVYLQNFEWQHKKAELGIFLGEPEAFGRGIGKEAAALLLEYGFKHRKLHKIVSRVLPYNTASIRTHEAVGYKQEAYLRDEVIIEGKFHDVVLLGVLNPNVGPGEE